MENWLITDEEYASHIKGFFVTDVVIRSRDILHFVLYEHFVPEHEDDEEPDIGELMTKVIHLVRTAPKGEQIGWSKLTGIRYLVGGGNYHPKPEFIGIDLDGKVYQSGSGTRGLEEDLPKSDDGPSRGSVTKLTTIEGTLFGVSGNRGVFKRAGPNQWVSLCKDLPQDETGDGWLYSGFTAIDAFGLDEIYCVGGEGDVWCRERGQWRQIPFPSNLDLDAVCCGGDGRVYISGTQGHTFVGRGDRWQELFQPELTLPFKDMVWYRDRVWCTSDYGVWWIFDDQLVRADIPAYAKACAGHLSAADNRLLIGGLGGAVLYEDDEWKVVFR